MKQQKYTTTPHPANKLHLREHLIQLCLSASSQETQRTYLTQILHCVSKKVPTFKLSVTLSNLNWFSKFLHCWKAYELCYKSHTTQPISP